MFASKDTLLTRPSGYTIARSVRMRSSATAYFNRTPASSTSSSKYTLSMWVKLGAIQDEMLFAAGASTTNQTYIRMYGGGSQAILWETDTSSTTNWAVQTNAVYRDPSAWYHLVFAYDSSLSGLSNQAKIYVNGVQTSVTTSGSGTNSYVNTTVAHYIGRHGASSLYYDGYLTEINFIDGQALTPSSFGETDSITGVWKPKAYSGTYGTNGFYLNFSDNSNNTAATIGKDYSGNGNNWTPNNISVTAGATYDSMTDVPTLTSATAANYAVLNPLTPPIDATLSNANLNIAYGSATSRTGIAATMGMTTGKFYWEVTVTASSVSPSNAQVGISNTTDNSSVSTGIGYYPGYTSGGWGYDGAQGYKYNNASGVAYGATFTTGDVVGVAFDATAGSLTFYKNGSSQGVAYSGLAAGTYFPAVGDGGSGTTLSFAVNFGQQPFVYTPPTGYVALNTYNLPAGTITTSGSFTGNVSTDGPFVYLNGVPTAMTINGNAVTFGTNADKLANGFKVRSSSSSYNASGSNTYSITTTGDKFKNANAQTNP